MFSVLMHVIVTIQINDAENIFLQFPPTTVVASRWQQRLAGLLRLRLLRENGKYGTVVRILKALICHYLTVCK